MIKKVLIAEDHESANISLQRTLEDLGILHVNYVYYCDDALTELQKALQSGQGYDLLVTDLHFEPDNYLQQLKNGAALIAAARSIQPDLKVLVFSAESKVGVIESLINQNDIDGFVRKARNDAKELKQAIENIAAHQRYYPRHLLQLIQQKNAHQFTDFDIAVIELLSQGIRQKDIPPHLVQRQIQPSGLSSIEKRLNHIREQLDCSNNEQLVAFCKDKGII